MLEIVWLFSPSFPHSWYNHISVNILFLLVQMQLGHREAVGDGCWTSTFLGEQAANRPPGWSPLSWGTWVHVRPSELQSITVPTLLPPRERKKRPIKGKIKFPSHLSGPWPLHAGINSAWALLNIKRRDVEVSRISAFWQLAGKPQGCDNEGVSFWQVSVEKGNKLKRSIRRD